ncbi:AAA family ATPase [Candidatus Bipolaricaulota bacterium]
MAWASPHVGHSRFFEELYVSREEEVLLDRVFQSASKFTIVSGVSGAGKTSLLHRTLAKARQAGFGIEACLIDFRELSQMLYGIIRDDASPTISQSLHAVLKEELLRKYIGADSELDRRLVDDVLSHAFVNRKLDIKYQVQEQGLTSDLELASVLGMFPDIALAESRFVRAQATLSQIIRSLRSIFGWERFVLCVDNTDQLASELQPILLSLLADGYYAGKGDYGTIVTIRETNLMAYRSSDTPVDSVMITSASGAQESADILKLNRPSPHFISEVLLRRWDFSIRELRAVQLPDAKLSLGFLSELLGLMTEVMTTEQVFQLTNSSLRDLLSSYSLFAQTVVSWI